MATKLSTIEFLVEQISNSGVVTYKKMFGEYMVYCNGKPIFLVCDDTLFVKMLPQIESVVGEVSTGHPYASAKEHYVIDNVDDAEYLTQLAIELEKITPIPKPRKKRL